MMIGCFQTEWVTTGCNRNDAATDLSLFFTASDPKILTACQAYRDRFGRMPTYREFEWLASRRRKTRAGDG